MFLALLSGLLTSFFIIQIQTTEFSHYDQSAWKSAANFLLEAMDTSVDPCKNFYQYACGKWIEKFNGTYANEMEKSIETNQYRLIKAIQEVQIHDSEIPKYHKMLKKLFDQCIRATEEETDQISRVYNYTKGLIGPMPMLEPSGVRRHDPYHLIGLIKRLLGVDVLIKMVVVLEKEGCNMVPRMNLGFSPPRFYLQPENFTDVIIALGQANGLDVNATSIAQQLSDILDPADMLTWEMSGNDEGTYRLSELDQINSNVNWDALFTGLMPQRMLIPWKASNPKIIVESLWFFKAVDKMLENRGYDQLVNFAYLCIFNHFLQPDWKKMMEGAMEKKNKTTEIKCLQYVQKHASGAAARMLFENIGKKGDTKLIFNYKLDLDMLVESVLAASRYLIHTAEWMDSEDKAAVVEKVNSMRHNSAIPDWVLDDAAVLKHTPEYSPELSLFENQLRIHLQRSEWKMELLLNFQGVPVKPMKHEWLASLLLLQYVDEPNFNVNAFYFANSLSFWLGIVLPPLYNYTYPLSMKFGLLGLTVAHELFHGFDYESTTTGRYDTVRRWLKPSSMNEFKKRSKCIMQLYSGYCDKKNNYCVSGMNNIDENIADMDGLKVAYMAYKFITQTMGEEPALPGLEQFTPDQLFFISAARVECSTGEHDYKWFKMGDTHSPAKARVELSMMNFPAFAQAFDCTMGSKFAPLHTCSLWGDFMEPKVHKKSRK